MRVLSLFDGMSCLQIALAELKKPVEVYYSSEIDKHAIKQTQFNFPDTIQLGDVTKWEEWDIDWASIDFIGAGSPCQGFSFAGKQLAFDDPRSKLFFEFVAILNHVKTVNPDVKFLLENVRMKGEHEALITRFVGVNPLYINSNLVSAQNRDRIYWTNIGMVQKGLFGEFYPGIPQPEDRGILLRDVLESEVDEKYYLSEKILNGFLNKPGDFGKRFEIQDEDNLNDKSACITQNLYKIQVTADFIRVNDKLTPFGNSQDQKISPTNGKSQTLNSEHFNQPKIVAMRGRETTCLSPKRTDYGKQIRKDYEAGRIKTERKNIQQLEPRNDGKTNALTSVQKDNLVMQVNPSLESNGKQPYQQNRIYDSNGIAPALCANKADLLITEQYTNEYGVTELLPPGIRVRRLTPTECARLQTIPDWYKWKTSDTQQYRMLGNGWTVEIIKHLISYS